MTIDFRNPTVWLPDDFEVERRNYATLGADPLIGYMANRFTMVYAAPAGLSMSQWSVHAYTDNTGEGDPFYAVHMVRKNVGTFKDALMEAWLCAITLEHVLHAPAKMKLICEKVHHMEYVASVDWITPPELVKIMREAKHDN